MEALALREWTRDEYRRAAEAGLFRPDERLELIDGQIVTKMSPQGKPHSICVVKTAAWLNDFLQDDAYVITQGPISLGVKDEPEPDVAVVWGSPDDDLEEHPSPGQIALLVEVADSSLARDRRLKVPRYALAGIAEVWLVDVEGRRLEIYREPSGDGYGVVTILSEAKDAAPLFAPEARVAVADLLPGRKPEQAPARNIEV